MIGKISDVKKIELSGPLVKHASMKALVSPEEGWKDYVMRVVELGIDGFSPKHSHPWQHINYILEGQGELEIDGVDTPISEGSYAYVPGNKLHQFRNIGKKTLKFICIVPVEGHRY
ncbi:MAG TPA: cupin [Acholeplasmataceae bacterium]|nr:MAG: cupin [Tenericutes bacterium GWD2_38_27]HBG33480.1 cupin [Acholeplasmataceae bacterium]HBY65995.1 cupin [Acholeplasmataceae bacterium]HCB67187.1 cupin [Acholeplasmataceae bacterium]